MEIRKELVVELFSTLPNNIKHLGLVFPENQFGYIRYDDDEYNSIYLKDIYIKETHVILKFDYYQGLYTFNRIYLCSDKSNEYGYDKNLKLDTIYLKGDTILSYDNKEETMHINSVIEEWRAINKYLETIGEDFISVYQVMKKGELVKKAYLVCSDRLVEDSKFDILSTVVDDIDIKNCGWFCKCQISTNVVSKSNSIYISIE
jgi:hypothetical protein